MGQRWLCWPDLDLCRQSPGHHPPWCSCLSWGTFSPPYIMLLPASHSNNLGVERLGISLLGKGVTDLPVQWVHMTPPLSPPIGPPPPRERVDTWLSGLALCRETLLGSTSKLCADEFVPTSFFRHSSFVPHPSVLALLWVFPEHRLLICSGLLDWEQGSR